MPISAPRDSNRIPTLLGTLDTNGTTVISVVVDSSNHGIKASNGTSGTDHPTTTAQRDANRIPALWAVSSADGVTPVAVYVDSSGNLMIKST